MKMSRNLKLAHKVAAAFVTLLAVILLAVGVITSRSVTDATRRALEYNLRGQAALARDLTGEFADKALQIATVMAQLEEVRAAYRENDPEDGRRRLGTFVPPIVESLQDASGSDDFRFHFHRAPAVSFYRSWTDESGDDLASFRNTILKVADTGRPLKTVELGRGGFVIRGIAPILDGGEYLGSVEVYYQPTVIVPFLDSALQTGIVLLVDATAAEELFFGEDYERAFMGRVGDSMISAVTDDWIEPSTMLDPAMLAETGRSGDVQIVTRGSYELAYIPLEDFSGEINGHVVTVVDVSPLRAGATAQVRVLLLVVLGLTVVGALLTMGFAHWAISLPLDATAERLKAIAVGDGDLTQRLPVQRTDEIGRVARHFNTFTEKLAGTVVSIKEATSAMEENARELEDNAGEAELSANSINGLVERVAEQITDQDGSISQSSSSVEQITGNIGSLEQVIRQLSTSIDDSAAAVEQMAANISSITRNLEHVDEYVDKLVDASDHGRQTLTQVNDRINEVVQQSEQLQAANQLIASVSAQTNLLAMNAAIEAAHAGEYGRGFAVVAEEIRNLAENSARQSKIISGELKKTREYVTNAATASTEADEAFTSVRSMVDTVNDLETSVRDALREQEEGGKSVMANLHGMRDLGSQVSGGITEISAGSKTIVEEMTKLVEISRQVTALIEEISSGSAVIGTSIAQVRSMSGRNREMVGSVRTQSDRFRT